MANEPPLIGRWHHGDGVLVPASRAALAAQLQQAAHTGINGTSEAARQKGGA